LRELFVQLLTDGKRALADGALTDDLGPCLFLGSMHAAAPDCL
jgi:hypothetical protein